MEDRKHKRPETFFGSHGRMVAVAVGCVAAFILLALVEFGFRIVEWRAEARECNLQYSDLGFVQRDAILGVKPKANTTVTAEKSCPDGRVIFKATYTIDSLARRVTPISSPDQRKRFILFFGGSFIFGEGIDNDGTVPYYVGRLARCYMPYNYGGIGYGPQQMLAKLEVGTLRKQVIERDGALIYGYMGEAVTGHMDRAIGSLYVYGWARNFPYYHIDPDTGTLVRKGNFTSGRPIQSLIYRLLLKSAIVRVLGINHPLSIKEEHVRLTARIIQESRNQFKKQFGSDRFYVVIFPGAVESTSGRLITLLEAAGIRCLDYRHRSEFSASGFRFPIDRHPTSKWNKALAKLVVRDLDLGGDDCLVQGPAMKGSITGTNPYR